MGRDIDVYRGHASWRKSSLDNLVQVTLEHEGILLSIEGPGEYWQSDDFESIFPGGTKLIRRRIQRKIEPSNRFYRVDSSGYERGVKHSVSFQSNTSLGLLFPIRPQDVGKWLTLEYDVVKAKWHHKITQGRL